MSHAELRVGSALLVTHTESMCRSGTGVLLIPGLGSNDAVWEEVRRGLIAEVSVAVCAGAGSHQAKTIGATRIEQYAKALWAIVEELGWHRVILVGHSVGALTAVEMAASDASGLCQALVLPNGGVVSVSRMMAAPVCVGLHHPAKLLAFVVIAAAGALPIPLALRSAVARSNWWSKYMLRWIAGPGLYMNQSRRRAVLEYVPDRGLGRALIANRHYWSRLERLAPSIEIPVALLAGDRDPIASPSETLELKNYFKLGTMETCEDAGHCIPLEAPEVVVAAVLRLLEERDVDPSRPVHPDGAATKLTGFS